MSKIPQGLIRLPYDTIEVKQAEIEDLIDAGLGDLAAYLNPADLAGWGFIKKIGRGFKKLGRKIKKFKFKKLVKLAIPVAAAVGLGPLAAIPMKVLSNRFGGRVATLIKKGRVYPQSISTFRGPMIGLVTKQQKSVLDRLVGGAGRMASEAIIKKVTGLTAAQIAAPAGSQIRNDKLELPVENAPVTVTSSDVPAESKSFLKKHGLKIGIAAGSAIMLPIIVSMLRRRR